MLGNVLKLINQVYGILQYQTYRSYFVHFFGCNSSMQYCHCCSPHRLSFLPLFHFSKPIEPDRLFDCLPNSLRPSSGTTGDQGDGSKNPSNSNQVKSLETAVYKTPTLIPPRIVPLLRDLAQQLVQAGHEQQCSKIYR